MNGIYNDLNLKPGSIKEIDLKGEIIVLQPEKKESLIEKNGITLGWLIRDKIPK